MKTKLIILASALILFSNCKKQSPTVDNNRYDTNTNKGANNAKVINNKLMSDYLVIGNGSDPEMLKIYNHLYLYMLGMKKVFESNRSILELAYNKAKPEYHNGIFLKKFICGSGNCKNMFNGEVATICTDKAAGYDFCEELANDMPLKGATYEPVIFFKMPNVPI